jgi:hypothetical protein
MKIELDTRPESAKFVVDGHPLDVKAIDANYHSEFNSLGLSVTVTFRLEELVLTDQRGVTSTAKADGSIEFSGTDEAAVRAAAGLSPS